MRAGDLPGDAAACRLKSHGLQVLVERPVAQAEFPEFEALGASTASTAALSAAAADSNGSSNSGAEAGAGGGAGASAAAASIDLCITLGGGCWVLPLRRRDGANLRSSTSSRRRLRIAISP